MACPKHSTHRPRLGAHTLEWSSGRRPARGGAGINNLGQVIGFTQTSADAVTGPVEKWRTTDLGLHFFRAAFNDNGVMVGADQLYNGGTLPQQLHPRRISLQIHYANAINDNGQIVPRHRRLPDPRLLPTPK